MINDNMGVCASIPGCVHRNSFEHTLGPGCVLRRDLNKGIPKYGGDIWAERFVCGCSWDDALFENQDKFQKPCKTSRGLSMA